MKRFRKLCVAIALCVVSSICLSITAYSMNVLYITRYQQENSNWCWAASIYMISKHVMGSSYSQSQIVTSVHGSAVNWGASISEAAYAMRVNTGFQTHPYTSPISYSTVESRINTNRPIYLGLNWNNGGGHAVFCDGYNNYNLRIVDPWNTCPASYVGYEESKRNAKFCSGDGRWVDGFYI